MSRPEFRIRLLNFQSLVNVAHAEAQNLAECGIEGWKNE